MTPRELARKMVRVSPNRAGWSVVLMDRPRKRDATRCCHLDFPSRNLAFQVAQIVRQLVFAAIVESRRRGGIPAERKTNRSRIVLSFPPFARVRQYFDLAASNAARRRRQAATGRLLRFPSLRA